MSTPINDTVAHKQLIVAIIALIALIVTSALSAVFGFLGWRHNLAQDKRELKQQKTTERQDCVLRVLYDYGHTYTNEFRAHCPHLSQSEIEKALEELKLAGEIISHVDGTGWERWMFKDDPRRNHRS